MKKLFKLIVVLLLLSSTALSQRVYNPAPTGLEIARNQVEGVFPVNKYGRNTNVTTGITDIWDLTSQAVWLAPTAARLHTIVSSDASDDATTDVGYTGAKTLRVYGLTSWTTLETSEDISLDGTADVTTTNSYVIIHRVELLTWGTAGPNVGNITITAAVDSTITAYIVAGKGQTHMAIYGVPSGYTLYINDMAATMLKSGGATQNVDIALLVNDYVDVITTGYKSRHTWGLLSTGTSDTPIPFNPPKPIAGPAIVKLQGLGSTTIDMSAWFNGELVKN